VCVSGQRAVFGGRLRSSTWVSFQDDKTKTGVVSSAGARGFHLVATEAMWQDYPWRRLDWWRNNVIAWVMIHRCASKKRNQMGVAFDESMYIESRIKNGPVIFMLVVVMCLGLSCVGNDSGATSK
jgi:hypothetical protein